MRPISRRFFIAAALTLLSPLGHSAAPPADKGDTVAFRRLAALGRGVNLSGWYGGWGEYSPEH